MGIAASATLLCAGLLAAPPDVEKPALERRAYAELHMGTAFRIVLFAPDKTTADAAAKAAFARIKQLDGIMSDYNPHSELSRLSSSGPSEVGLPVGDDLWRVLSRAQSLAAETDGAFDVTVGPLVQLWRRARRNKKMPAAERLAQARRSVGYRHVRLDPRRHAARLMRGGMRLDLGGIAKGDAADQALAVLARRGVTRALVDASGDVAVGDPPPGKTGWRIGVAPLDKPQGPPSRTLVLARSAVATSGDAFQYVELDGVRYSHILDPRTGLGLTTRSSVTVIAPDGLTADSLASAVSVLGPREGLKLIAKKQGTECLILRRVDGKIETHQSAGFEKLPADDK